MSNEILERVIATGGVDWNGGGGMHDDQLGVIQVFREYVPKYETIEYTVYFWTEDREKMRVDVELTKAEMVGLETLGVDVEQAVRDKIYHHINRGYAVPARQGYTASKRMYKVGKDA